MFKLLILVFTGFISLVYAADSTVSEINDKVEIFATTMETADSVVTASGDVAVVYKDYYLTASKAVYDKNSGDLELFDNVRANQGSEYKTLGNYAKLNIKNKERSFQPFYMLEEKTQTWISADKGMLQDRDLKVSSGVVSSCNPENPLWKMEFSSSDYNLDDKWLNLYNTRVYIYDIPIFYTPWFGYSLDKRRRTGLLMPAMGYSQDEGFYYEQPLYIAEYDEWDLELRPQVRTDRGAGLYSTLRFADSLASHGDLTLGYFKEKKSYYENVNLQNQEHYGFDFDYEHSNVLNDWLDLNLEGQSGLYADIGYMNDVDYINLASNDTINTSTATQIISRVNLFYNTENDYFGSYFKYYQYLDQESNRDTLQELPKLHYHHYLETLFDDHLLYNVDMQSKNIYREKNKTVVQTDLNVPISLRTSIFDEYLDLSFKTNMYGQHSGFHGTETREILTGEYENGYVLKNDNVVSLSTQLTKAYTEFSHVIAFGTNYVFDGFETTDGFYRKNKEFCEVAENANEPICEFYNISDVAEEFQFDFSQYIYDVSGKQILYHRLVQNVLTRDDTTLGDLENELDYMITNEINFYNNTFYNHDNNKLSKIYNRISYRDYGFDVSFSHLYRDTFLDTTQKTSYMTTSVSYQYNSHWKYHAVYDYDIELDVRKRAEVGFIYSKRCWDFGIRYAENNRPELGRDGQIANTYDKYIYFTIALKPFMSLTIVISLLTNCQIMKIQEVNKYNNILDNRQDAARKLLDVIPMQKLKDESWKIIAVSKGGLSLAAYIRAKLTNKIDFLFSEAIMAPNNDECEVARVSEGEEIVINESLVAGFEIQYDYIYGEARRKHEEKIISSIYRYRKGRHFGSMENEVVLLVDEGSETGTKFMVALKTILAQKPKAVYIAVPVLPKDVLELLEPFTDEIYFLYDIGDYVHTSLYYKEFEAIDDETIEKLLEEK